MQMHMLWDLMEIRRRSEFPGKVAAERLDLEVVRLARNSQARPSTPRNNIAATYNLSNHPPTLWETRVENSPNT